MICDSQHSRDCHSSFPSLDRSLAAFIGHRSFVCTLNATPAYRNSTIRPRRAQPGPVPDSTHPKSQATSCVSTRAESSGLPTSQEKQRTNFKRPTLQSCLKNCRGPLRDCAQRTRGRRNQPSTRPIGHEPLVPHRAAPRHVKVSCTKTHDRDSTQGWIA